MRQQTFDNGWSSMIMNGKICRSKKRSNGRLGRTTTYDTTHQDSRHQPIPKAHGALREKTWRRILKLCLHNFCGETKNCTLTAYSVSKLLKKKIKMIIGTPAFISYRQIETLINNEN